jgi:hypothetical protein
MPAIAAQAINDGQSSPVSHSYVPVSANGSRGDFADRAIATFPAGMNTIFVEVLGPSGNRTTYQWKAGFYLPLNGTESDGTTPKVMSYDSAQVLFNFSPQSSEGRRKDARAYVANWLAKTDVINSIVNVEPFY